MLFYAYQSQEIALDKSTEELESNRRTRLEWMFLLTYGSKTEVLTKGILKQSANRTESIREEDPEDLVRRP